eukprot:TRINITY_DN6235_c0_g1_i12.p1 TRINITY_DN6235_c0_g1~~TRINITY_DN6235_c0_g1_i12.p1  ORF type:complete len:395 (+),score=52.02 TRINITY_DN6235_c0_g1_i12:1125-2309(+)
MQLSNVLLTNSVSRRDFVRDKLLSAAKNVTEIYIAAAFFTEAGVVRQLLLDGQHVRLIVRLGFPTSPDALAAIMQYPKVDVRFFTDQSFHPKLYIFGDQEALVGSANLTGSAIVSNQEIVVGIDGSDERFNELASVFSEYWASASVLTKEKLQQYRVLYNRYPKIDLDIDALDEAVQRDIGLHVFHNIGRDQSVQTAENIFLETFHKTYQEAVSAFGAIRSVYEEVGLRKAPPSLPLRLEIDSFISYVRDTDAAGEAWRASPIGWGDLQKQRVRQAIRDWLPIPRHHFENIVANLHPRLIKVFASRQTVLESTDDQLFAALQVIHSFHDRFRFKTGGQEGLRADLFASNSPQRLRESLAYLIFGPGDPIARMADQIGRAVQQECRDRSRMPSSA